MPAIRPEEFFPPLGIETVVVAGVGALRVGAGPTLLLLHGGTGSWTHRLRNIEPLARHFRLVVPDLPGWASRSTCRRTCTWTATAATWKPRCAAGWSRRAGRADAAPQPLDDPLQVEVPRHRDTLGRSLARLRCPVLALLPERDPLPQPDTAARAEYLAASRRTSSAASCPTRATGWPTKPPSR
jgi:pimeloyl-ACP methyl ester carboxylesterase